MFRTADAARWILGACALWAFSSAGGTAGPDVPGLKGPLKISARHAEFDERGKKMLYRGDVKLVSQELELRGDRLELQQSGKGLYQARVTGAPARLTQAAAVDSPPMSAHAEEIVYNTQEATVALSGGAVLLRGADELTGELIKYNASTRRIQARGSKGGQIRFVIQPPKKDEPRKEEKK